MGHVTVCAIRFVSGKGSPPWVSERAPFGETVHPGLGVGGVQMAIQPLKLAHEPSPETKQKQKLLSQLEESHPRRGSPHWDRLSFEQVLMSSPPCGEQEGSEGGNGTLWTPLSSLASCLPWAMKGEFPNSFSREGPGWDVSSSERLFARVNSEDRGALAKLVEAIRTSYNDRYAEIHHHCEAISQVQTKSVALIAKMERQRLKILPPNWDESTMLTFLYIKIKIILQKNLNLITVSSLSKFP